MAGLALSGVKVCAYKVVEELLTDCQLGAQSLPVPASPPASAGMSNSNSNTNSALQKSADTVARAVFKSEKGGRNYSVGKCYLISFLIKC